MQRRMNTDQKNHFLCIYIFYTSLLKDKWSQSKIIVCVLWQIIQFFMLNIRSPFSALHVPPLARLPHFENHSIDLCSYWKDNISYYIF